jgi:hypothetical protein
VLSLKKEKKLRMGGRVILAITMRLYVVGKDRMKEKRWDSENRRSNCFGRGVSKLFFDNKISSLSKDYLKFVGNY